MSATGAFATIILERLLDVITVLGLLASFVFVFGRDLTADSPLLFSAVKWAGATAAALSLAALVVLFLLAGNPARLTRALARLGEVAPSALAGLVARIVGNFASGLGAIRRPGRLLVAFAWSFPLWISIALGIWAVAVAFGLPVPFTGSFLLIAILVIGVAVPTPGAVGGFHEAFRLGATAFYGASEAKAVGAAIVLHALSFGPSLVLGLYFAAQVGLNVARMRELTGRREAPAASGPATPSTAAAERVLRAADTAASSAAGPGDAA
jgi:uncharacterized membrane protein YbhN (UPF0104 family)